MEPNDLEAAYRRYFGAIRQKCNRMLGDPREAEDVAQEAFTRLLSAELDASDPRSVVAWAYRTATRLCIDRLRRAPELLDASRYEQATPERAEAALLLREALRELGERMREDELDALCLARVDRMSHAEIADVLGTSDRQVRRLLEGAEARLDRWKRANP